MPGFLFLSGFWESNSGLHVSAKQTLYWLNCLSSPKVLHFTCNFSHNSLHHGILPTGTHIHLLPLRLLIQLETKPQYDNSQNPEGILSDVHIRNTMFKPQAFLLRLRSLWLFEQKRGPCSFVPCSHCQDCIPTQNILFFVSSLFLSSFPPSLPFPYPFPFSSPLPLSLLSHPFSHLPLLHSSPVPLLLFLLFFFPFPLLLSLSSSPPSSPSFPPLLSPSFAFPSFVLFPVFELCYMNWSLWLLPQLHITIKSGFIILDIPPISYPAHQLMKPE